jgi:hypothetical protein
MVQMVWGLVSHSILFLCVVFQTTRVTIRRCGGSGRRGTRGLGPTEYDPKGNNMADPIDSGTATSAETAHSHSAQKPVGMYAFRFSGFAMRHNILYHLAGVGQFAIDAKGRLVGSHRSSLSAMQGQGAKIEAGNYALEGEVALNDDGVTGHAKIHFVDQTPRRLNLDGEFYVVVAGSTDRLWLVSSADSIPPQPPTPRIVADELVSLEAVRIAVA